MTSTLASPASVSSTTCMALENVTISYGSFEAVRNVFMNIPYGKVTAFIGPSGCGKSTVLRALNRMNDLIPGCHLKGKVVFEGQDLYHPRVDPVEVRRRIGMVFQKPNPFPSLGRVQGQTAGEWLCPLRWSAATPLHRPRHRHRARCDPDGRTLLGS